MKKIGILGGTFNPIHNAHLAIARQAKEQFRLDQVWFLPSGVPYMKEQETVLPYAKRCEMVSLAIAGESGFSLSRMEEADALQGKNSYTCDTLQKLREMEEEAAYFFILGADSLAAMERWRHPERIFRLCTILAAVRAEGAGDAQAALQERLSAQIARLKEKYHAEIQMLSLLGNTVSSTEIRRRVREGASVRGLLPEAVEAYIREQGLYQ